MIKLAALLVCVGVARGDRWAMTFAKQYGYAMAENVAGQAEMFVFLASGKGSQGTGITNNANNGTAVFGKADQWGDLRLTFNKPNDPYDMHVFDPSHGSDQSEKCYWLDGPNYGHYRWEFHWFLLPDNVTTFPTTYAYNFDKVVGFNTPSGQEPAGFKSDDYDLTDWADYQAQTFVVPPGINRIVAAKAFCVRSMSDPRFTMVASIRKGTPDGDIVGKTTTSREVFSDEFEAVTMSWNIDDVPVVPGQTYAFRVDSLDGKGFNAYGTKADNYPQGQMYNGAKAVPGRDLVGLVVGVKV